MILNSTRKKKIADRYVLCETFLSQSFGLIGRIHPTTLVFVWKKPIIVRLHMIFVFFPIDVILLDHQYRVVEVQEHLRPFTFFTSSHQAMICIECPAGSIKQAQVRVGDTILIKELIKH